MKGKIIIVLSFLMVGMILFTNEPPTYSKEKEEEYTEDNYDIASVRNYIFKDAQTIKTTQKNLTQAVKQLKKDNIRLKEKIEELQEPIEPPKDSIKVDSTISPKKKGFLKKVLGID